MFKQAEFELTLVLPYLYAAVSMIMAVAFLYGGARAWKDVVLLDQEERNIFDRVMSPFVSRMVPRTEVEVRELRMRLNRAGIRGDGAVRRFTLVRATVLGSATVAGAAVFFSSFVGALSLPLGTGLLYLAYKAPEYWLDQQILGRQLRIARALPSTIDLMVLCLDVGLSVEAAFERVTQEMRNMEPLMAEEAQMMVGEMGAGLTFPQSLKRMADRIDIDELTTLSRLISQASGLGASITQSLREYSEASFTKRMLQLEEHAGKISAYLVMPLTVCMLPASLLALMGPAAVTLMQTMGG